MRQLAKFIENEEFLKRGSHSILIDQSCFAFRYFIIFFRMSNHPRLTFCTSLIIVVQKLKHHMILYFIVQNYEQFYLIISSSLYYSLNNNQLS